MQSNVERRLRSQMLAQTRSMRYNTHRMELRSLPPLLAYALLSLVSLVFLLILKKTSSPCDVTT